MKSKKICEFLFDGCSEISLVHKHHIQLLCIGINDIINEKPDGEMYDHWVRICNDNTEWILANLKVVWGSI